MPCAEGFVIQSGAVCNAQCLSSYKATPAVLDCWNGTLSPQTFRCEAPCVFLQNGSMPRPSRCLEDTVVVSGATCTAECPTGYIAEPHSMRCMDGHFENGTFACKLPTSRDCEQPANIPNAAEQQCLETRLYGGGVCTARCQAGFKPSANVINCFDGQLTPPTFSCLDAPCEIPQNIAHGAANLCPDLSNNELPSGMLCKPRCAAG